ncbi:MAG: hypothetical protein WC156_09475 [Pedobacter sp.]
MTTNEISMPGPLTSSNLSATAAATSSKAVASRNLTSNGSSLQDQQISPVDSVTIFNKLQDSKREARKEEAKKIDDTLERTMNSIQFTYNNRGNLRIRFTDSSGKLVYQIPSLFYTRISDLMVRPQSSVNTEA